MKKKFSIIPVIITIFSLVILGTIFTFYFSFKGNPITKVITASKAKDYVESKWPGEEFTVSRAVYNFKFKEYVCRVQSLSSEDTAFKVYRSQKGELRDSYKEDVMERGSTIFRFERELRNYGEQILLPDFSRRARLFGCSFYDDKEYDYRKFQLDMEFDPSKLPVTAVLTIWTETKDQEPTWEDMAEVLK